MLRSFVALVMEAAVLLPSHATAQQAPADAVDPAVATCLRANAARVSQEAASLVDAADFLLNNVCAVEIAAAYRRQQQAAMERIRARFCQNGTPTAEAIQSDPGDDEGTAAYLRTYCSGEDVWSNAAESITVVGSAALSRPADRALAAELILEARRRR